MNHIANRNLRFSWEEDGAYRETLSLLENGEALPVLRSAPYASVFTDPRMYFPYLQENTRLAGVQEKDGGVAICLEHPDYSVTRLVSFSENKDAVEIQVTFTAKKELACRSLEDRWSFLVPRKKDDGPLSGPLDFVWSQRIKSFPTSIVSHYNFRNPIVMMQQDTLFTGLVPALENVTAQSLERAPLGMDLDVTRED